MTRCVLYFVIFLIIQYSESNVYHVGSKITFFPDSPAGYFGYALTFGNSSLLVGAPKTKNRGRRVVTSGLVFTCPLDLFGHEDLEAQNVTCHPMFDENDPSNMIRDFFREDMWFGAAIAYVPNGKVFACAPRLTRNYTDKHLLANGACYLQTRHRGMTFHPLEDQHRQAFLDNRGMRKEYGDYGTHLNFYAYAQSGMSIKVTDKSILVGAPGLLQWTGGIVDYRYNPKMDSYYVNKKPVTNPYYTKELGPDNYLGYSVEAAVFEDITLYVAGAPRAKAGYGQVIVFEPAIRENDPLKIRAKLEGPQLGSYFGATLCCMDINGDGRIDLVVGAPNYVKDDGKFDQGAVFVYLNKIKETGFILDYSSQVSGSSASGARFGSAISALGDIDGDGYKDIAISAPWESDGLGAVYIYRGSSTGISGKYIQRIVASEARGLGMSLAAFDVDKNHCNDIAIGAFGSATAYIYRCVPSIQVVASIVISEAMDLPHHATNFTVEFCVDSPTNIYWPHVQMDLKASITIDAELKRAMITDDSEFTLVVKPGNKICKEKVVDVKPTADLSKPISIHFDLEQMKIMEENATTFPSNAVRLLDESKLHTKFDIQLTRDCGEDLICRPWLEMILEPMSNPYVPGSNDKLGAIITVLNKEEPAYGIRLRLLLPTQPKRVPRSCNLQGYNMTCDLPAPLHRNGSVQWEVELEYSKNVTDEEELVIEAVLEDPGFSRNISDDADQELVMEVLPEANFDVSGRAVPNATILVTRDKLYEGSLVTIVHYFEVTNTGPSDWYALEAELYLPDNVTLSKPLEGCVHYLSEGNKLDCIWEIPANLTLPVVLSYRFDLKKYGPRLLEKSNLNITTTLSLYDQNESCSNTTVTTRLVLEPAPPIWPIIAGAISGLLLLAALVYSLKRCGFFSRKRVDFSQLQSQELASSCDPGASGSSSDTLASPPEQNQSTQELLLYSDSDEG